jgi:hypothetical protein
MDVSEVLAASIIKAIIAQGVCEQSAKEKIWT